MTIGIGLEGKDGVVLAADSLVIYEDAKNHRLRMCADGRRKILGLTRRVAWCIQGHDDYEAELIRRTKEAPKR